MQKKYLIFPRVQLKYSLLFALVTLIQGCVFVFMISILFDQQAVPNLMYEVEIPRSKLELIVFGVVIVALASVLVFFVSVLVLHRFLGPIVAVERALKKFEDTGRFEEIKIRKTDEMGILIDRFNSILGKYLK